MTIMQGTYIRAAADPARRSLRRVAVLGLLVSACSSEKPAAPAAQPPSASILGSSSPAAPKKTYGAAWDRAVTSGDEADLARLALEEGATGLLEALDDPAHRAIALAAIAHAPDRDLAIGPLAARLGRAEPDAAAVAGALVDVLAVPGLDRERLDPTGEQEAARVLLALAHDASKPAELRAKAVTALGRLAERGVVRRDEIPTTD